MAYTPCQNSDIGEIVRKAEHAYTQGQTTISKYVSFNMHETISTIEAYLNSKHTSGLFDSQGREKPFFNICIGARNIWFRATDIDRRNIKIKATKQKDFIESFLATIHVQEWMRRNAFGQFLNEWGRVLASYGSAVLKFVENSDGLTPMVMPWNRMIVDPIDFNNNVKIEVLELTEAQLRKKKGYDKDMVNQLCEALNPRETLDKRRKDNKSDYIKLYEVHGELPLSILKLSQGKEPNEKDSEKYVQQMHVVSFVGIKGKRNEYSDFTLFSGEEDKDPYMITHLIKEDGRTLAIGAVEHLFESQWMKNNTSHQIKTQLDIASKILFQGSDGTFVGQNLLGSIDNGDYLLHAVNQPISMVNNKADIAALQSFGAEWKQLGNEINGISDAMQGEVKAGSAWRQTEALLQESHSLFELMTENKGLHIEEMMREYVLPYIKKQMDTADEISATLDNYDLQKVDSMYIRNFAIKSVNEHIKKLILGGGMPTQAEQQMMMDGTQGQIKDSLANFGNQRFFKPSDVPDMTWKELFKDLEWDLEIDVTGESKDVQEALTTIDKALQLIVNPLFGQNKKAQFLVSKALELSGSLSPVELSSFDSLPSPVPVQNAPAGQNAPAPVAPAAG